MGTTAYVRAPLACENDPDLFFPLGTTGDANLRQIVRAQRACEDCPIKFECKQAAIDRDEPNLCVQGGTLFPLRRERPQDCATDPAAAFLPKRKYQRKQDTRRSDALDLEQLAFLTSFHMSKERIAAELGATPTAVERALLRERAKQRQHERDWTGARFAAAHITAARLLDAARPRDTTLPDASPDAPVPLRARAS